MNTEPCLYFNSPSGCWFGDHCRYPHVKGVAPRCRFYSGPGTCRNGSQCYFRHTDPEGPKLKLNEVKTDVDEVIAGDFQNLHVSSSADDKTATGCGVEAEKLDVKPVCTSDGDTRQVICKGKSIKCEEDDEGDENNDSTNEEGEVTCEVKKTNNTPKQTLIKCGECGKLIDMKVVKQGDSEGHDLDDRESVGSMDSDVTHNYNALEKHYYDKLLSMNKDHLSFLQHDPRFHRETLCNVCHRVFGKTRHLLQHITDKVKSGSDDEENHKELLHELVLAFTTRDLGMDDDKECLHALLLHLVASYTGDSDSSSSFDSDPCQFGNFLRMLLVEESVSDSCNPWGFDEDDMFELACQGIKPWDPEAGMAIAVLSGAIDI